MLCKFCIKVHNSRSIRLALMMRILRATRWWRRRRWFTRRRRTTRNRCLSKFKEKLLRRFFLLKWWTHFFRQLALALALMSSLRKFLLILAYHVHLMRSLTVAAVASYSDLWKIIHCISRDVDKNTEEKWFGTWSWTTITICDTAGQRWPTFVYCCRWFQFGALLDALQQSGSCIATAWWFT